MPEEKKEEEAAPDWLEGVLAEAEVKRETNAGFVPPPVSQVENDFLSISEEEKAKRFKRGNMIIIGIIIFQIIMLGFVIWWP